jgi:hypothetical protein
VQGVKENHGVFIVFAVGVGYSFVSHSFAGVPMMLNRNAAVFAGE